MLKNNVKTLYKNLVVQGQCSDAMQAKVQVMNRFKVAKASTDGIVLLRIIKAVSFNVHGTKYVPQLIVEKCKSFYASYQGWTMTVTQYYEQYKDHLVALTHVRALLAKDEKIEELTGGETVVAPERFHAVMFLLRADNHW
jgi:hypothetical protein